jgi:hypothetical protein
VGLRVDAETFAEGARLLRESGVTRVEYDHDGSVSAYELAYERRDTEPAPPPSDAAPYAPTSPLPGAFDAEEQPSDRIARELAWLARRLA